MDSPLTVQLFAQDTYLPGEILLTRRLRGAFADLIAQTVHEYRDQGYLLQSMDFSGGQVTLYFLPVEE
ncbi:MAG: hypothetical protein HC915_04665 [Anaerolineae bacterium]|nr:hypothetical protein [Anaerolineae bacterium]